MSKLYLIALIAIAASSAEPPSFRLPGDVQPLRYRADLTIIPEQDTFVGRLEIALDVRKSTNVVWLNASNLNIDDAKVVAGGRTMAAKVHADRKQFAGFVLPGQIPQGQAKLQIDYRGELNTHGRAGLFKRQEGGEWYVFSQFESIDARQAFPCFDEPGYKVPWQLTLHVRKQDSAVSNTPVLSESDEAGGRKRIVFAETKPLPSYLVALAVGPFEFVAVGKAGKNHTELRIITPKGKATQTRYATEVTSQILTELENYFGIPYPYEKLDCVAVPLFGLAMENPGLITYEQNLILSDPARDTIRRQRNYASMAAHEIAHQWFGDLVTPAWWNDIWLNEAFASWMAAKVVQRWKPEWNTRMDEQTSRLSVMQQDSLMSAREIRQPVDSNDDLVNAFDNITYLKGQAVIAMFESWVGEAAFQRGVQQYLRQYSWRNATAADFLDSVASSSNPSVTQAFSTFLNQPGVPLVSVRLTCHKLGGATLHLSQKRALPLGSLGSTRHTWQIPVCVRYGEGGATRHECALLAQASMDWKLAQAHGCPVWVQANVDATGYYRAQYEGDLFRKLLMEGGRWLSAPERVAAVGDLNALTKMGEMKAGDALVLVPQFASDPVRQIVASAADFVEGLRSNLVPSELLPNYMRLVDQSFGERARQLGWKAKPGEGAEARLLRARIVPLVALWGRDRSLAAEARQLAERWLADRNSVDADVVEAVLRVAARTGDGAFFKRLEAALGETQDGQQRRSIFGAMGLFLDPAIARSAMDLVLKPEFDLKESFPLLFGTASAVETRALTFEFVKGKYETLVSRMPPESVFGFGEVLPFIGSGFCDNKSGEEVRAFFEPKLDRFPGTRRNLVQTLEIIRLCIAYKAAQEESVVEFLRNH